MNKLPDRYILLDRYKVVYDTFHDKFPKASQEEILIESLRCLAGIYECSVSDLKNIMFN